MSSVIPRSAKADEAMAVSDGAAVRTRLTVLPPAFFLKVTVPMVFPAVFLTISSVIVGWGGEMLWARHKGRGRPEAAEPQDRRRAVER